MIKTLKEIKMDGRRWGALISSGRIRILGTAGMGDEDYQHFGAEFWSKYNDSNDNSYGIKTLKTYVDTIIKNTEGEKDV